MDELYGIQNEPKITQVNRMKLRIKCFAVIIVIDQ